MAGLQEADNHGLRPRLQPPAYPGGPPQPPLGSHARGWLPAGWTCTVRNTGVVIFRPIVFAPNGGTRFGLPQEARPKQPADIAWRAPLGPGQAAMLPDDRTIYDGLPGWTSAGTPGGHDAVGHGTGDALGGGLP